MFARTHAHAHAHAHYTLYNHNNLCRYAGVSEGDVVLDPMCGVGTIPIEGATGFPWAIFLGGEKDQESLDIATTNLSHARKSCVSLCELIHWDATDTNLRSSSVDTIICDMPWGQRSGSQVVNIPH